MRSLDPDVDFEPHKSGDHDRILRDLIEGTCDLGGTFSGSYQTADTLYYTQQAAVDANAIDPTKSNNRALPEVSSSFPVAASRQTTFSPALAVAGSAR